MARFLAFGAAVIISLVGTLDAAGASTADVKCSGPYTVRLSTNQSALLVEIQPNHAQVDRVLLRSPYKSEGTALPTQIAATAASKEAVASFDLKAVRALPAGGFNVVIAAPTGERICRVSRHQQAELVHSE